MSGAHAQKGAAEVRRSAGLFAIEARGLVRVTGEERTRWLNGMISNDVSALEPGPARSGCYATLLTPQGRIVADLHVMLRPDAYWLETAAAAVPPALERLDKLIIADDVTLEDVSAGWDRLGLEGPKAGAVLAAAAGAPSDSPGALAALRELTADGVTDAEIGSTPVVVAAFGFGGPGARQIFAPAGRGPAVAAALRTAAAEAGLELHEPGTEALEILRIEAGTPLFGSELGEDTLPDEARLERAISTTKGCYTGQEIVARLRSRGGVKHRLVGLRAAQGPVAQLPAPGTPLERTRAAEGDTGRPGRSANAAASVARPAGRATGELTSRCVSSAFGPIGLGFVHRDDADAGTMLVAAGTALVVAELPFSESPESAAGGVEGPLARSTRSGPPSPGGGSADPTEVG